MITSVFKKSTPIIYSLVVFLILVFFLMYQFQDLNWTNSMFSIFEKVAIFAILLGSIFITNFIAKKNVLSKDSTYTIFFTFLFLLFFPSIFNNFKLVISNFFVLLAFRRLISLQSLKASKEKIFDASLWIFVATFFHFWSVLFILLVFISIFLYVSRDYRNWILPFIALFIIGIIFVMFSMIFNQNSIQFLNNNTTINLEIDYFTSNYQNIAFSIYATIALFFIASIIIGLSKRPLILHTRIKKIITFFFIGVIVFLVSPNKTNDLLIFTLAPLAMIATNQIEIVQVKLQKEIVLYVLIACSLFAFFSQL